MFSTLIIKRDYAEAVSFKLSPLAQLIDEMNNSLDSVRTPLKFAE